MDFGPPPLCAIPESTGRPGRQGVVRVSRRGSHTEAWAPLLPSFSHTSPCICHQWKFPLGLPVPGMASSFPGPHCTPAQAAVAAAGETLDNFAT